MENVSQQTLRRIVKKYFQLFRDKDYIDNQVMLIKTMDPNLAHEAGEAGYTKFKMYKDGEIIKTFAGQKETLSFEEDKDTFLNDTIILSIDLKFSIVFGALETLKTVYPLKLYNNGVLSVYPGDDCLDKNRITSLELLFDVLSMMYKHNSIMECVGIIKVIISFKENITNNLEEIKKLKESDLPETNALNDSIVQLALRYKDSQDPTTMVRSPGRTGLRKLKKVNYTAFGSTDLEGLRVFYRDNAKQIIGIDNGPFIDIIKKPIYLESCGGVSNLIRDLERIKENMGKALETAELILDEEMNQNYQTEPKNYDNPEEFEKEKKKGFISLKKYIESNRDEYYNLFDKTRFDKNGIKFNRSRTGEELKNITGRVHTTIPFAFGRKRKAKNPMLRLIEADIRYLSKKG